MPTIEVTVNEETRSLPARKAVCPNCEGHGSVLHPAIAEHAYSSEEFYEEFDEWGRSQYFMRGGAYDVTCPECKGLRVVDRVDLDACDAEERAFYQAFQKEERERERFERECAAERRYGA